MRLIWPPRPALKGGLGGLLMACDVVRVPLPGGSSASRHKHLEKALTTCSKK
ncbi:hypothetical protein TanjilG_23884 [Lupinus angustifolius]|uniref:Uncharacterized protein n=1 Tax=Lupinus angustifolius TaxID=3871 RepID=A0A1J7HRP7_LUPAN|nr:hypothetical protein TanjilG_23884 [Lupinus angustifolius]